jgi:hypothetical protein
LRPYVFESYNSDDFMIALAAAILYIIEGFHDHNQWLYGKNSPNELANIKLHKIDFIFHFCVSLFFGIALYYDDYNGINLVFKVLGVMITFGITRLLFLTSTLNLLRQNRKVYYRSSYSNLIDIFITKNKLQKAVFIAAIAAWIGIVIFTI